MNGCNVASFQAFSFRSLAVIVYTYSSIVLILQAIKKTGVRVGLGMRLVAMQHPFHIPVCHFFNVLSTVATITGYIRNAIL